MKYGQKLDRIIRELVISYPALAPVYILKEDVSDGFYCIGMRPTDAPNVVLVLPSDKIGEELVTITLTVPMEWNNSPPIFFIATEIVTDLENTALRCNQLSHNQKLYDRA